VIDDHDMVGELVGLFEILGGKENAGTSGNQFSDRLPEVDSRTWVKSGRWLVEEKQFWRADETGA
jgi:hypothetical protein